jgi:membrane protein YdbS with pleckstrin-like domain
MESMDRSAKLLGADERVVLRMRTHAKALVLPAAGLVLGGALLGVGTALVPTAYRPVGQYAVVVAVLAVVARISVLPFLRWRNRTYTLTNHRLITRQGILSRTGHDLPLMRVDNVSYQRSLTDRVLGCGTLYVQTAADGALVLDDVPEVGRVHLTMTQLLFGSGAAQLRSPAAPPAPEQRPSGYASPGGVHQGVAPQGKSRRAHRRDRTPERDPEQDQPWWPAPQEQRRWRPQLEPAAAARGRGRRRGEPRGRQR